MSRLLYILPYVPYPPNRGTYQRTLNLARELARHFELDLFCLNESQPDQETLSVFEEFAQRFKVSTFEHPPWKKLFPDRIFDPVPTTVRHWQSETVLQEMTTFVDGQHYDRVLFCDLVLWPYMEKLFPTHSHLIMDRSRVDWLFQLEELNTLQLSLKDRFLRKENLFKIARMEKNVYSNVTAEIVCGWDDRDFIETKIGSAEKVVVLANGYNERYFDSKAWPPSPSETPRGIFCGALDYSPNVDALEWYVAEIHDRIMERTPSFTLSVVGKSPTAEVAALCERDGIDLVGEVPDVRPHYQKAWLHLVPLRIGGGTRLKIVESLGLEIPVLSTTLGAQGLEFDPGSEIRLADSAEEFAETASELLSDRAALAKLGANGRDKARAAYTWSNLVDGLAAKLKEL